MWPLSLLPLLTKFVTGIDLGAVLPTLAGFGSSFIASVKQYWKIYLIAVLVGLQSFTFYEWQHTSADLKTEKASHIADVNSYKQAQADAQNKADATKKQLQKESQDKANAADSSYANLLATYHANLVRYKTLEGIRSGPSGGSASGSTQVPNGTSSNPQFPSTVTITADDAEICTENTARLSNAHDWALTLGKSNVTN